LPKCQNYMCFLCFCKSRKKYDFIKKWNSEKKKIKKKKKIFESSTIVNLPQPQVCRRVASSVLKNFYQDDRRWYNFFRSYAVIDDTHNSLRHEMMMFNYFAKNTLKMTWLSGPSGILSIDVLSAAVRSYSYCVIWRCSASLSAAHILSLVLHTIPPTTNTTR